MKETLINSVDYLLDIAEAVTIHSIMGSISSNFPYVLEQISDKEINRATPIRYRLSIDPTKLNVPE